MGFRQDQAAQQPVLASNYVSGAVDSTFSVWPNFVNMATPGFASWQFVSIPAVGNYLLHVDLAAFESVSQGFIYWQVVATPASGGSVQTVSDKSMRSCPQALGVQINTSFRAIINFNSATTWTIKLQWCTNGGGGGTETANTNAGSFCRFTLQSVH